MGRNVGRHRSQTDMTECADFVGTVHDDLRVSGRQHPPNPYITPDLCFQFHYFAIRKMHFLLRARALVFFPGGFGTIDELFDALTLIQTGKVKKIPVMIFGREYWDRVLNFERMAEEGMISPEDIDLIRFVETPSRHMRLFVPLSRFGCEESRFQERQEWDPGSHNQNAEFRHLPRSLVQASEWPNYMPAAASSSRTFEAGMPRLEPPYSGSMAVLTATTFPFMSSTGPPLPPWVVSAS